MTAMRFDERPDRVAMWAVVLAVFVGVLAAATAHASSGGVSGGSGSGSSGSHTAYAANADFGDRTLRKGDKGDDVKTLNWILKSLDYAGGVPAKGVFGKPTHTTVRKFQRRHHRTVNGVVSATMRKILAGTMSTGFATWYGPGLYGNRTACGQTLSTKTVGFATPTGSSMKCGAQVVFKYGSHWVRATKIDTGPGVRCFDLTKGLKDKLHFPSSGNVRYAVASGRKPC